MRERFGRALSFHLFDDFNSSRSTDLLKRFSCVRCFLLLDRVGEFRDIDGRALKQRFNALIFWRRLIRINDRVTLGHFAKRRARAEGRVLALLVVVVIAVVGRLHDPSVQDEIVHTARVCARIKMSTTA